MADAVEATLERRIGQEGSRWYNAMPTGPELSRWFKENVDLHEGLVADSYIPGVTMIPATEKAKTVVGWNGATPIIEQVENLVYVPYAKVETRVKYFHDLMAKHDDWLGVIEPVATERQSAMLPKGFFPFRVATGADTVTNYICCTMKVTVFKRDTVELKEWRNVKTGEIERVQVGETIIDSAPATKMIGTLGRYGADDFSLMKAETGAIGRALGMAGMLVIPGTGIATAEDMQEAEASAGRRTPSLPDEEAGEAAQAPPTQTPPTEQENLTDLRQEAVLLLNTIKDEFPPLFAEFQSWATERKIGEIGKVEDPRVLRGLIAKAQRELTAAREGAEAEATVEEPAVPGDEPSEGMETEPTP